MKRFTSEKAHHEIVSYVMKAGKTAKVKIPGRPGERNRVKWKTSGNLARKENVKMTSVQLYKRE